MIYLKIIILAIAVYIFFRSLKMIFNILPLRASIRTSIFRLLPVLELILWIAFSYWAVQQLFDNQLTKIIIDTGIFVIILIILAWYLFRDLITGVILKAENTFKPGENIRIGDVSGKIIKTGARTIKIVTVDGELFEIPFSKIINQQIIKPSNKEKKTGHTCHLKVPSAYQPGKVKELVKRRILEIPWIINNDDINVNIIREDSDYFIFEVVLHTLSSDLIFKTEEILKNYIKEVFES